ncbi:hypothetical protein [Amycolatopsis sp. NPDC051071]|uniref:hypothetical protein n=1 Tax=Amycolatopsis sp. NPDC051071 TaxID=3154637 RepID=UPI00343A2819
MPFSLGFAGAAAAVVTVTERLVAIARAMRSQALTIATAAISAMMTAVSWPEVNLKVPSPGALLILSSSAFTLWPPSLGVSGECVE